MSTQESVPLAEGSSVLGRYRILRRLGEGAFGTSFLAEEAATGRRVVLKVASSADEDGSLGRRLVAEGRVLSGIDHPRVARLRDVGALGDGRPFLVLEWVDGPTLEEILLGGPLSVPNALAVVDSLASALEAVHRVGVIHRDLKPTNIVVPGGPEALRFAEATLIDFGAFGELVRSARSGQMTQSGQFFGTPYYMAPEQVSALPQSPATDVYGLGLLLYAMLFGKPPHHGKDPVSFMVSRLRDEIALPAEPAVPGEVRTLLSSLLHRDAAARPQSAKRVRELVGRLQPSPPSPDQTGTLSTAPPSATGAVPQEPTAGTPPAAPSRPGPVFVLVSLAGGLILAAALFLVAGPGRRGTGVPVGSNAALGITLGFVLIGGGVALGLGLRRYVRRRGGEILVEAGDLLLGTKKRDALTTTLATQIEELISRCRRVDERILGMTIRKMYDEYQVAADSNQRQAALMSVAQLLEKLMTRLSPWYIRHEKALAFALSLVGVLTGTVSLVASVLKLLGNP